MVLIKPIEGTKRIFDRLKHVVKVAIVRGGSNIFEPGGISVYRTNPRDIEKMMIALNYRLMTVKPFNDFDWLPLSDKNVSNTSLAALVTKFAIFTQNVLSRLKLMNYGLGTIVIIKNSIDDTIRSKLIKNGFSQKKLA